MSALTDDQVSIATGSIAIDPKNPDTIYAGTGEENFAQDSYYGAGLLKSVDGGSTWTNIPGPFARQTIGALAIDPNNTSLLLCATNTGIWRSSDAGVTWSQTLAGAAGISVYFDPSNSTGAFATLGSLGVLPANGVYHSADRGITWTPINGSGDSSLPAMKGRIELALTPSNPRVMYAQIADVATVTFGQLIGIYKTTDGGANWSKLPIPSPALWGNQLWFTNTLRVSPINPDVVWSGALQIYRSMDGGTTWTPLPQAGSNHEAIHVDFHYLAFTSDGSKLYLANDGGIYSTTDVSNASVNWTELNDTLAITQFYPGMAIDPGNPLIALGGTQDNNAERYTGDLSWTTVACGDGGAALIDPSYTSLAYTGCTGSTILRGLNLTANGTWLSASYGIDQTDPAQFIAPLTMDPGNPQTLYFGTYRLYQSLDGAGRWNLISDDLTGGKKGTVRSIGISAADANTIYVTTSNGKIQVTRDASDKMNAAWADRSAGLALRTPTHVVVDPLDSATAYVAYSGFKSGSDQQGHVFKTTTAGSTWVDISGNLPDIPVNQLVIDPDLPGTLYIGTDAGVMATTDGGGTWSSLGNGLPNVVVNSLVLHRRSRVLRAGTHGRGVWDIAVPLSAPSAQPLISSISPASVEAGGAAFALGVTGSNFTSNVVVRWNGQDRQTQVVDAQHLIVQIPASDIAAIGRASVMAYNASSGNGASNSMAFLIGPGPVATAKSVVSAANPLGGNTLALRSIATVYGLNLASRTSVADLAPPLPSTLGDTSLTMVNGGQTVPLFYVSATQISFQVPFLSTGAQELTITQGLQSLTIPVTLANYAPAIFTANSQGSGQASALIANTASIAAPVGAFPGSRPAKIGEYISIYCTGLGDVTARPVLGYPSPSNPLASTLTKPVVTVGGIPATVSFSGLAPGYVGLYQVNVQVPAGLSIGPSVPVVLNIGGVTSNTAQIAVDPAP